MKCQRRDFLRDSVAALGFGALSFGQVFAAPQGWKPRKKPNIVFGVLSDTHFRTDSEWRRGVKSNKFFVSALEYFRSQNVDAVVHCGDMADRGLVDELQLHADAWYSVFPENKLPNGDVVEKLFVSGNHDIDSWSKDMDMSRFVPNKSEWPRKIIKMDSAGHWKRIWGEEYQPVWHKVVKGYHFFGQNWNGNKRGEGDGPFMKLIDETLSAVKNRSSAPFFFISHDRKYGMFAKNIRRHAGGFGIWGHWHLSAANWRVLHMLNASTPGVQCPACPSWWRPDGRWMGGGDGGIVDVPIEGKLQGGKWEQGLVIRVYNDMLTIECREFSEGGSLGDNWVMPLKVKSGKWDHPFSHGELRKVIGNPQFKKGAKLSIEAKANENVRDICVKIPYADGNPATRVYGYEVVVSKKAIKGLAGKTVLANASGEKSDKVVKAVYACGCNMGITPKIDEGITTCVIPEAELPSSRPLIVTVRPFTSLGTFGKPIVDSLA